MLTSVCSCEASVRPGANGTVMLNPAFFAARSTAAQPPSTMRSAREMRFRPDCDLLKSCCTFSSAFSALPSSAGSLTSQFRCGSSRIRAPLAPPRLSVPRKLAAADHAVDTSREIDSPDARILSLRAAMSCSPISS